jgi:hypothetical protein
VLLGRCGDRAGIDSVSDAVLVLTVPPLSIEGPPPKRARVNLAKNKGNSKGVLFKRSRGCLSELPTMPLDILYEVGSISCLSALGISENRRC